MTREFFKTGLSVPVTVVKVEKGRVINLISQDKRGYNAVQVGFGNIKISSEPYKITGITSFLRYLPYLISIYICSISFCFVYGQWEGFLTPNIVFYSEKV